MVSTASQPARPLATGTSRSLGWPGAERRQGGVEDRAMRLDAAVADRADACVDVEAVVRGESLEIALAVGDESDAQPGGPQHREGWQRVLVEEEVLVPLPLSDDVERTRPRARPVTAHPDHDLLGEGDP